MEPIGPLSLFRPRLFGLLNRLRLYSLMLLLLPVLSMALYWFASGIEPLSKSPMLLLLASVGLPVIISYAAGHAIARTILGPLKLLVQGAEKIHDGEYGHTIDLSSFPNAPTEFEQLVRAFNRMSSTVRAHVDTIRTTSLTDQLTGLCNRRHLLAEGYRIINVAIRGGKPCSCLMIDIDHFKEVNDNHGHPVGDKFLVHVARCIAQATRDSDLVARYGGEEFVVLAPNASLRKAVTLGERIREIVAANPLKVDNTVLNNTVSIGVTEYDMEPDFGANILEDMIEKADKAMYRAKQHGRNRVESWPFRMEPKHAP